MTLDQSPVEVEQEIAHINADNLRSAIEAILMVTDVPLSLVAIATALDNPVNEVRDAVLSLKSDYDGEGEQPIRGFELREVGGGWRIYVRQDFDWAVRMFIANENPTKLSQAALETLAVIAYKQPISRGQIASIRAVNVDSVVRTLLSRGLISELYTDSETGAINYGTTELLLEVLGINSLDELPLISPFLPDATSNFDAEL
ncbi:SMC-Scp complex subunit ScpB [Rhodoluna sp.]|uniref:SMC-Scp complex subunit ScpB n=1 Tax=Rhodoluna sp. TaxID=1969481 RepID=UPI0025E29746|nr:SMC-Scp complex subunit ScpB [Rhodoluna sp.]